MTHCIAGEDSHMNLLFEQNEWLFFAGRAAMLALALLCFAVAFGSWHRAGRRDMQRMFDETRTLSELTQRLATQLGALEARIDDRRELNAAASGSTGRGYEIALQLARNGAHPENIVNASGVTRHEAQLLSQLHNPSRH
jgi:hypothetical protein